jgi:hypothetical protein
MSDYYDQPRRQKSTRGTRTRDSYVDDSGYSGRDAPRGDAGSLVRRHDSTSSVDEEITREFPPGDGGRGYYRETTIRKKGVRPVRARSIGADSRYDDRYFNDRSSYASSRRQDGYSSKRSSRGYDDRRGGGRSRRDQSSSTDRSRSRSRDKGRRKSGIEETLGALGLGGVVAAVTGKKDGRSRSKSRDRGGRGRARSYSSDRGGRARSKSRGKEQISQAIKAALLAGAGEAFRARKEPGGWGGDKGKRVLTAAIAAGGVDGILTHKKDPEKHSTRDVIGSALAGLAANRVINGARSKSRGRGSPDGRGRSQSRGGLGDLLAGGALAATAKKGYDRFRSKSRGRDRSRGSSGSSFDSRSPPRNRSQNRRRSQSVSGYAAKGLAAIGLKDAADKIDPPDRRSTRRGNSYNDGGYGSQDVGSRSRSIGPDASETAVSRRSRPGDRANGYALDYGPHHNGDPDTDSDSDLGSSSGEEKEIKRGRRKSIITAGLATVATIHAGHSVYQSYEKRDQRRKQVKEGKMSPEEAKKLKNKGRLQDAAAIGIAALGIKGAYSEWQEMREHNSEMNEYKEKMQRHREKREARRQKLEREARAYKESGYTASMPNLVPRYNGYHDPLPAGYSSGAPTHYYDDNPYSAGPATGRYDGFPPPPPGPPPPNYR